MQVFIGGAHSGKTAYVKQLVGEDAEWQVAVAPHHTSAHTVVLNNLEAWLVTQDLQDEDVVVAMLMERIRQLQQTAQLYIIVADVGRGIVPLDPKLRQLRDVCGRFYQQLFKEATSVTRVWYGLTEKLK
ncbi:hypothetical protein GCM10007425_27770 [Lysinibacillus alkalisoli]|uniref:Adenosylcobinamide kinase n=1 Tax=Lysinibacillus alkalisoli TaxID=1911548 RepID=A0A917G9H9_9BACI|nr:bifunctional adenosylcobinamide kinase/adenosylcobinamide-phosphate guanylyltransferase [Lysinibacillus alkalisoli]GGG31588.1 hypothetical protein GCM10007425_27770 [Lysinibacillus alkalisoli]